MHNAVQKKNCASVQLLFCKNAYLCLSMQTGSLLAECKLECVCVLHDCGFDMVCVCVFVHFVFVCFTCVCARARVCARACAHVCVT